MKKTKRIGVIYAPLNISTALIEKGGSLTQTHSAENSEFVPDRELTPLVLVPEVYLNDPDGIIPNGKIVLSNVMWYALPQDFVSNVGSLSYLNKEISQFLITPATQGYSVAEDGTLTVSKNIDYLSPVVLVFTANYADGRSGKILRLQATATLSSTSVAIAPSLTLDKPATFIFNPMEDTGLRTINASLMIGGKPVTDLNCSAAYWWYKIENGAEVLIDPEEDLFYEGGAGTASLKIDPRYINKSLCIVCKAEYALAGETLPAAPTSKCQIARTTVVRRYPDYDFENYVHGGVEVPSGASVVKNECVVTVGRKVLDNPSKWFTIKWSIKKATHDADWMDIGYGDSIFIDAKEFENGADVGLEVDPFDPLGPMMLNDEMLCENGEILTF